MLEIYGLQIPISKTLTAQNTPIVSAYIKAVRDGKKEAERILGKNKTK